MTKIPNIADIIASYSNQDKTLQETAADLGAIILEMEREEECYGKHSKRLAELKELATLQEKLSTGCWIKVLRNLTSKKDRT